MKIAHIPKANYKIGQKIKVFGKPMIVESYSHTGKNVIVVSLPKAARFERIVCIVSDNPPITAID
jgi:hypothetical protein